MSAETLEHCDQLAEYEFSPVAALAEWNPVIAEARAQGWAEGEAILKRNHDLLMEGEFDRVPMPVDAIGDARWQVAMEDQHGQFSPQALEASEATVLAADRALAEAMRALTWEKFAKVRRRFDPEQAAFVSQCQRSILAQLDNGLSPIAGADERSRRLPERVEEVTYNAMAEHREFSQDTWVLTLSLAGKDKDMGYVQPIDKWMARGISFGEDEEGIYRDDEQIGLSGERITEDVIDEVLWELEVVPPGQRLNRAQKLSLQIVINKEDFAEPIDFIAYLDAKVGTFMGEPLAPGQERDYAAVALEAERRHREQEDKRLEIAAYSVELARNGVDAHTSQRLMHHFINNKAHEIVSRRPEAARVVFGDTVADAYELALELERRGEYTAADGLRGDIMDIAAMVPYCGAGACGLERLAELDAASLAARTAGLNGELLRSTESTCPDCKKGGRKGDVIVDMKGNKFCADCGSADVRGVLAAFSNLFAGKTKSN